MLNNTANIEQNKCKKHLNKKLDEIRKVSEILVNYQYMLKGIIREEFKMEEMLPHFQQMERDLKSLGVECGLTADVEIAIYAQPRHKLLNQY